mgnify:FL=1
MTLIILAAIFAVLGFALIVIPFHVAMTGICFLGLSAVCILLRLLRGKKHERTWRVILLTLTGACMLTVFGAMAYIDRSGRSDTFEAGSAPEFVVVLGAQVQGDEPSLTLKKRLDKTLEFMQEHPDRTVIVSGGQGPDEAHTEASVMARYLIEHGVDESRVIQEEQAHDTRENLEYSRVLAEQHGMDTTSVLIITSDFHLCRAKYLARRLGMEPYGLASQTWPEILRVNYLLREVFAFIKAAM